VGSFSVLSLAVIFISSSAMPDGKSFVGKLSSVLFLCTSKNPVSCPALLIKYSSVDSLSQLDSWPE